jgi:3-oxoacyl-[acyl-carrier protein] reductase
MKRVFVTGGSRGIGRAIVEMFARSKEYAVTFTYNSSTAAAEELARSLGDHVKAVQLDLLNVESLQAGLAKATADGGFDIVVHNAAATADSPLYFMNEQQWNNTIDVSLNSFFYINKAALSHMIQKRWGRIIAIASISGEAGNRGQCNYAAAKGALIAASKSLAREVASRNILVNVVSPGLIATDMTRDLPLEELTKAIPMGRIGKPEEVAGVVSFLASDSANYVTGEVIRVNGGFYT